MGKKRIWGLIGLFGMIILVLDSKTMIYGASEGINVCLKTVIPSLFPFMILSNLVVGNLDRVTNPLLRPISRFCGVPSGTDSLLIIGLIGGYPLGAQAIANAYENRQINITQARRLLGFCNNAGPAFIFGMSAVLFDSPITGWVIWGIQIVSAIFTGTLLPLKDNSGKPVQQLKQITIVQALKNSIFSIGSVCGWVVLFRVLLGFLDNYIFNHFPDIVRITLFGLLEISNGSIALHTLESTARRFILMNVFLSFGGVCVWMQTMDATSKIGSGMYLYGKALQCAFSALLAVMIHWFLFPEKLSNEEIIMISAASIIMICGCLLLLNRKNSSIVKNSIV